MREALPGLLTPGVRARLRAGRADLVMGLAAGYGEEELGPFLRSLRGPGGHRGPVALIALGVGQDAAAFLRAHGARPLPFLGLRAMPMSMNSARMFRYLDALLEAALGDGPDAAVPGRVLLADTRDVVFQADPFALAPVAGEGGAGRLRFHLETGPALRDCPTNADWARRALGPGALAEFGDRPVACAGTLLGTSEAVAEYLVEMLALLLDVPFEHRFSGVDQAAHNAILWRGHVAGSLAVANGTAEALTVPANGLSAAGARLDPDGVVRAGEGCTTCAIVHQYDRDPALRAALRARHAAWVAPV